MIYNFYVLPSSGQPVYDEHTRLLLHGESIEDSSMYNIPLTNHSVALNGSQKKFGNKSLYFNGNNAYISFSQNSIIYGANDFTFDWWEYPLTANRARFNSSGFSSNDGTAQTMRGMIVAGNDNVFTLSIQGMQDNISVHNVCTSTLNIWTHWAFVRKSGVVTVYRNGIKFKQFDANASVYQGGTKPQVIGVQNLSVNTHFFHGYIDEFRISDIARWTSNFEPPTEPYNS